MLKKFLAKKFHKKILEIYPLTLILSIISGIMGIRFLDSPSENPLLSLTLAFYISIPLCAKFEGALQYKNKKMRAFYIFVIGNLFSLFMYFEKIPNKEKPLKIFLVALLYTLLFFFTPSKNFKDEDFNLNHFVKSISTLLNSIIFSITLYLGLIFIIFSLKELFNINFGNNIYVNLYILVISLFFVPIFLSGIEDDNNTLYSKFFEFLLAKVIFPLLVVYLFILYAYLGKIFLTKTYPKNIVPYLTLAYSFGAVFFYYLSKLLDNKYISKYLKSFFILLIPVIAMTYFSIIPRLLQYSITEKRYFILIASLWFTLLILVNIFIKNKAILFLRNSLLLFVFMSAFGPLSATSLSKRFQAIRLENLLEIPKKDMQKTDLKEIYEILLYFSYNHSILDTGLTKEELNPEELMKKLGFSYNPYENIENNTWYNFESSAKAYNVKDFEYYIPRLDKILMLNDMSIELNKNNQLILKKNEVIKVLEIKVVIEEFLEKYKDKNRNDKGQIVEELVYYWKVPDFNKEFMIIFKDLNFNINEKGDIDNSYYEINIFVKELK